MSQKLFLNFVGNQDRSGHFLKVWLIGTKYGTHTSILVFKVDADCFVACQNIRRCFESLSCVDMLTEKRISIEFVKSIHGSGHERPIIRALDTPTNSNELTIVDTWRPSQVTATDFGFRFVGLHCFNFLTFGLLTYWSRVEL